MNKLPDFIIIGAQRCGTTALYRLLCQHTRISAVEKKEVHYFDQSYHLGKDYYEQFFRSTSNQVSGEATPYYIFHPDVPYRIKELLPDVRLIALLRNPVDRAFSQYHLNRRRGEEPLATFEASINAEQERLNRVIDSVSSSMKSPYDSHEFSVFSYLARGRYAEQIERWLMHFDRTQMLFIQSEDFYENTFDVLRKVHTHLDLPEEGYLDSTTSFNPSHSHGHLGTYEQMAGATRERLNDYFLPYNERLSSLLNQRFDW